MENITRVPRRDLRYLVERTLRTTLALLLFLDFAFAGNAASCISSTGVREGEAATIICNYHINLREEKTGFYVYRYPFDGRDPDTPFVCDWDSDSLICDVAPGYETKLHNESVTLTILSAKKNHAGTYSCKTFQPSEDQLVEDCKLTVQEQSDEFQQKSEVNNNMTVYCHATTHLLQGQPKSIMCFVHSSFNARSIILKRFTLHGASEAEELARCDKRKECRLNAYGYEISSKDEGLTAVIATVDKPGRYVCTAEGDEGENQKTGTCSLSFGAAPQQLSEKPAEQWFEPNHITIIGLVVIIIVLLVAVLILSCRFRNSPAQTTRDNGEEQGMVDATESNTTSV